MKSILPNNNTEMHSTHNEIKPFIAERVLRILKIKIYKYMISVSKSVYIDKLDDIVNNDMVIFICDMYTAIHIIAQLKSDLLM